MTTEYRCPACNAELAANAPRGLCPACLLKGGLGTQTGGSQPSPNADFVPPTPAELAPLFPELEVIELVGRGGMGVVYQAKQKRLDRLVALKILSPKIGQDQAFADRFQREARAMGMLNHPHIVAVYDFGQTASPLAPGQAELRSEGGLYYFLMEFVDGVNVRQLLDTGKLAPKEALAIVPQICEALQYAHDHGVVHRDIKPENLLLDKEGRVKIADFGIAKLVGHEAKDLTLTGAGQIVGTPQYMAPEQIEHPLQVDHRADIYSLGVVFYQMLTGELPIGLFAAPSKKVQIDVRLDEVVLRALEKEPERRYQQASEVKSRVETIVTTPSLQGTAGSTNVPLNPVAQPPQFADLVAMLFGMPFTSNVARKIANASSLGFLAFLAFLSYIPLPGMDRCLGFSGFSGFFGLIGIALMVELAQRRRTLRPAAATQFDRRAAVAIAVVRWTARILGTLMLLGMALFFVGEGMPDIPSQPPPVRVEFVGFFLMALGMAIGWKSEGWAALSILAGTIEFHVVEGRIVLPGALNLPLFVGVLYALCWWMQGLRAAMHQEAIVVTSKNLPASEKLSPQARSRKSWIQFWVAGLIALVIVVGIGATVAKNCFFRDIPYGIRFQSTKHLLQEELPNQVEESGVWNELTDRLRAGSMSPRDVDAAVKILIAHMTAKRPKGWDQPLTFPIGFLDASTKAGIISPPVLLELCDAFYGPKPIIRPLPRLREGADELPINVSYGNPWERLDEESLGAQLLWQVERVRLDGKPIEVREVNKLSEQWSGSYLGTLKAGDHQVFVDVECAYVDQGKLIGLNTANLPANLWPEACKRWKQSVSANFKVYTASEQLVSLATDPAQSPGPDGGVRINHLIVQADRDGKKKIILKFGFTPQPRTSLALSYDVAVAIKGHPSPVTLGPLWIVQNGNTTTQAGFQLEGTLDHLDPSVQDADIILIPNPRHVERYPEAAEIWGKKVILRGIPLERLDLTVKAVSPVGPPDSQNSQADPLKLSHAADMRTIVLAILEYATEHPAWPAKLDELKPKYLDAGKIDLSQFVYYPLRAESLQRNPVEVIVLAEKVPTFASGRLVGFADGYVEFIRDRQRLKQLFPSEAKSPPAAK